MRKSSFMIFLILFFYAVCCKLLFATTDKVIFQDDFYDSAKSEKLLDCSLGSCELKDGFVLLKGGNSVSRVKLSGVWPDGPFILNCRIRIVDGHGHGGVRLENADGKKFVYIFLDSSGRFVGIASDNLPKALYTAASTDSTAWHDLKIEYRSGSIDVYLDNTKVTQFSYPSFKCGNISFFCYKISMAYDDFAISKLSAKDKNTPVNLVNNSSFEYAIAPNVPLCWGLSSWGVVDDEWIGKLDELWKRWRRDTVNPYHGKYCMRVDGLNGRLRRVGSTFFYPNIGETYTLSAWLRSNAENGKVKLILDNYMSEQWEKIVTVGTKWQRVSWTFSPVKANQCSISFNPLDETVLWVDAVQVVAGTEALPYTPDAFEPAGKIRQNNVPIITAPFTDTVPEFDGTVNDSIWEKAARMNMVTQSNGQPREKTEVFMMYDMNNIYLGFRCYDRQMDKIRAKMTQRDSNVWEDDSIEIFVGPSGPRGDWADYYHLGVSVTGTIFDGHKTDPGWNRDWKAKTMKFPDRWEAEVVLPFKMFDLNSATMGDWTFNVCRENGKIREYSCWSPTFGNFHKAENFGILKAFPENIISKWVKEDTGKLAERSPDFITTPLMVAGKPFVGYGVTWQSGLGQPGKNTFQAMRKAGMNLITLYYEHMQTATEDEMHKILDLASEYNIGVTLWIGGMKGNPLSYTDPARPAFLKKIINMYKRHSAVVAWMVVDEPHSNPQGVLNCYKAAKEADSSRPVFINITSYGLGMRIAGLPGDILSMDLYPVKFDGSIISDIGPLLKKATKETNMRPRPMWMFLQGFGYTLWVWRGPTPQELTAQIYTALVNGVTSINLYNGIIIASDTWERAGTLGAEIRTLTPVLLCNQYAKVTSSNDKIEFMARIYEKKIYILAVNPYDNALDTKFILPKEIVAAKRIFAENTVKIKGNTISDIFMPYERHCYEISIDDSKK